ncbi:hypothetical protein KNV05_gp001 [Vibrio phage River4]|uniref:Uncharacterized protein n=1 Tax=Vibrio phage River4 TaxID=2736288 RepID=A0A6M9Z0D9_9CAUD|nr:hypothetical protein KNV05_gp001 [Vibrio phage River4]QKN84663.1 hypothetical protein RIVER4_1 [Vibrio phage River4]
MSSLLVCTTLGITTLVLAYRRLAIRTAYCKLLQYTILYKILPYTVPYKMLA